MMTRHEFLWSLLGLGVGAATLAACGTDTGTGDPGGPDEPGPDGGVTPTADAGNPTTPDAGNPSTPDAGMPTNTCSSMNVSIGSNHGHSMTVAMADLNSTAPKSYAIRGSSSHPHTVTITPAQFATLKATGTLSVTSSTDNGHPHTITVTCA
jgi:hypothetical protein